MKTIAFVASMLVCGSAMAQQAGIVAWRTFPQPTTNFTLPQRSNEYAPTNFPADGNFTKTRSDSVLQCQVAAFVTDPNPTENVALGLFIDGADRHGVRESTQLVDGAATFDFGEFFYGNSKTQGFIGLPAGNYVVSVRMAGNAGVTLHGTVSGVQCFEEKLPLPQTPNGFDLP